MTVKNAERTIEKCMQSLIDLDYPKYEVLMIDGFSTDKTWEILQKYDRINVRLVQMEGNVPSVYNRALGRIFSDYVALTDGDVVVDKNWLKELIKPFKDPNVVASAGIAKNPPVPETNLQKLIGKELESRYYRFPKEITRAATMNMMVKTDVMKEIKFDESLSMCYDTDFGYEMTANPKRKMIYHQPAVIYHYHRPTWKSFFKQQYTYAKFLPIVYSKHIGKSAGDHISKPLMMIQPFTMGLGIIGLILTPIIPIFFSLFGIFWLIITWLLWLKCMDDLDLQNNYEMWMYHKIFFVRNIAWVFGLAVGIFKLLSHLIKKRILRPIASRIMQFIITR